MCICGKRPESKRRSHLAAAQVTRALSVEVSGLRSLLSGLVLCVYVCVYVCALMWSKHGQQNGALSSLPLTPLHNNFP